MQRELGYLFSVVMPVLLVSTGGYICFGMAACAASAWSERVGRFFASKSAKSLPFALIVCLVAVLR